MIRQLDSLLLEYKVLVPLYMREFGARGGDNGIGIAGTSAYLPLRTGTNSEMVKLVEWIGIGHEGVAFSPVA